ncbi:hypothetical protein ACHAWU_000419 [Discostella pseudostelligera]|uniref:FAD dependent oxidoreductase domain-containing protein n=1 Tax=Discostella pseudostelligera TaxID=259834 RepID=A0ABD3M4I8_9STRA
MRLTHFVAVSGLLLAATTTTTTTSFCHGFATITSSSLRFRQRQTSPGSTITTTSILSMSNNNNDNNLRIPRDILIIGGGLAGLSAAHYIASQSPSQHHHVTILERELPADQHHKTVAGSFAAAGMLAPQSERLPAGPLLDICLQSREMYGNWVKEVERGAREASLGVGYAGNNRRRRRNKRGGGNDYTGVGAQYLWELVDDDGILHSFDDGPSPPLEPWETGFHSTGGFLAPAFAGDAVATWSPQPQSGQAMWLDEIQVRELEPMLHPSVIGGWWFPEDASVDARRLTCSLRAACAGLGVQMNFGPEYEVKSLEMGLKCSSSSGGSDEDGDDSTTTTTAMSTCRGVHLANGQIYAPKSLIVANGSWMRNLLPLPVVPHKGQSLSLRMPSSSSSTPPILSRVLFAQDTYIVPKADGRIIVGATVEPGRFDGDVTPSGMLHCMSEATRLVPSLADLPIEECWAGLRPTTPDKCPILGGTDQWDNVYLAGGYWRNGVLLAPKTGQLIGDLVMNDGNMEKLSKGDRDLLKAFAWERFTSPGGGKALAANARYAATFYPVHKRSTTGVASSVGTELGFYEGASAAKGDRERDRDALFGAFGGAGDGDDEALERAAMMGVDDARAFSLGDDGDGWMVRRKQRPDDDDVKVDVVEGVTETMTVEADHLDALTVGLIQDADVQTKDEVDKSDLSSIYAKIKANKRKASESIEMEEAIEEERPDPGFRIHHVDSETGELTEVPPYTSPGEFFQMKAEGKLSPSIVDDTVHQSPKDAEESEPLFDGYTAIREAYGEGSTAEETAESTRRARMSNRIKSSEIDESKIGAMSMPARSSALPSTSNELSSNNDEIKPNNAIANGTKQSIDTGTFIDDGSDEKTYDGYQAIQQANSASSREEELRKMKEARQANRSKSQL